MEIEEEVKEEVKKALPEHVIKLDKDLRMVARTMTATQARYMVNAYYSIQDSRKRSKNQVRAMADEPHSVVEWYAEQNTILENEIKVALDQYSNNHPIGHWVRQIKGIGPVIAAGLIAHIDIEKAPTAGHIWSYAGLDPNKKWLKGQVRPFNANLKVLCWKIGQSFVKVSGGKNPSPYGVWYVRQKAKYIDKNRNGDYADRCASILTEKRWNTATDAYAWYSGEWVRNPKYNESLAIAIEARVAEISASSSKETKTEMKKRALDELLSEKPEFNTLRPMLPPAHIDQMAQRWAVKLFLAHLQEFWYEKHYGKKPPMPYAIAVLQHAHYIPPPGTAETKE